MSAIEVFCQSHIKIENQISVQYLSAPHTMHKLIFVRELENFDFASFVCKLKFLEFHRKCFKSQKQAQNVE